jgi:hypothetical protein
MARQELYAWTSLASTLALLGLFLVLAWGLPEPAEGYAAGMIGVFVKVIAAAFVVELVLGLSKHTKAGMVDKDERDILIEGRGFRNAYYFVMAALCLLAGHLFVGNLFGEAIARAVYLATPALILQALLIIFLVTSLIKALTQLYYYRRGV